ncbi:Dynein regulatory complex protein 10 [Caenorhabditis elegans]|uniref:Dynein regulatory complex protein 10 n=1 Tax=Caenorhabditis elegans TaxID=6239 RepID=Q95ZW5_CAEEL|nr:Dynein regulatory complex protein 10 [Caenorhabditis elegans]CAC42281.1 Dynein regulatory complex protein 10 [Caenorhabditis elegans]|eukprot:NP_502727.1 Uncharacterized protein CELE_F02H6.3 [Caenorhabditis elegans]
MDVADLIDFSTEIDNPPNNGGERVQDHVQQREVVVVQQDLYGDDQEIAGNRQNEKAITEEDETLEEHEGFADTLGTLHGSGTDT